MKPTAIVTPWFGKSLKGGAEQFAWQIAKKLSDANHDIDVLTTCCRSFYDDWSVNYYDVGEYSEFNYRIHRFRVNDRFGELFERVTLSLRSLDVEKFKTAYHGRFDSGIENVFLNENINSTQLCHYIKRNKDKYQSFIFIPYLYGTTLNGLPLVPEKAYLQPCLHNETYAYLGCVENIFRICKGILFNSEGEYILANRIFGPAIFKKSHIVGGGCENHTNISVSNTERINGMVKSKKFILYIGKRDKTKNTDLLIEAFIRFKKKNKKSKLELILTGPGEMNYENTHHGITDLEEIDDNEKENLLKSCISLFQPSHNESYSRVIMEAWFKKKPVVVHKNCLATSISVRNSNGGWLAGSLNEWIHILEYLDNCERFQLNEIGENGYNYAVQHGSWSNTIKKYERAIKLTNNNVSQIKTRTKRIRAIHQMTPGFSYGDAITNQTILIRNYLRASGYDSEIYSLYIDPKITRETIKFNPNNIDNNAGIIYHHSIGSVLTDYIVDYHGPKALIYHNITPHELVNRFDDKLAKELKEGREDLKRLSSYFRISVGDSNYNAYELKNNGFEDPDTLPIIIDPGNFDDLTNHDLMERLDDGKANIIYVSRITPSKCQHDLIQAFYEYMKMDSNSRLILIGSFTPGDPYCEHVAALTTKLGIEDDVIITKLVTNRDLQTYCKMADLFWSMSEHEGFGVPLIESFWFDIPVLAFKSSAVPETLGKAGLMFNSKENLIEVAALAKLLVRDSDLREKMLISQRKRREDFLPQKIYPKLDRLIDAMIHA